MKKTPLNAYHRELRGKMIDFFGWEMPVEYSGIVEEHMAVRERAGVFDVSHMGEIIVSGKDSLALIQYLTCNDASRLSPNMAQYTALTTDKGTFVDDLLVYCLSQDTYLLVVNAANTEKDFNWIEAQRKGFSVEIENMSLKYTQLALQGPRALEILQPLISVDLEEMKSFHFEWGRITGEEVMVSRTGYTGEDGFEIYTCSTQPGKIWEAIMERGKTYGLLPVGLGARDTLRLEAKLMLYGNDINDTTTVLEADLGWLIKFKKGDFLGRDTLLKQKEEGIKRKIIGFELVDRGIARPHHPVVLNGEIVSEVTSGSFSPCLRKSIGLAYLPVEFTSEGTEFEIDIRGKRAKALVVSTPFYKRS